MRWLIVLTCGLGTIAGADDEGASVEFAHPLPAVSATMPGVGAVRQYDWFRQRWNERKTAFAADAAEKHGAVVFFGDSIMQGWNDDFRGYFTGINLANRGIGGDTTRGMLVRLQDDVLSLQPAGVVMLMGTNDLAEEASPAEIAFNVGLILNRLRQHDADMPVILCAVMPSAAEKDRPAESIQEVNRLLAGLVKANHQVTFVDTYALFANADGDADEAEFPDRLHPNAAGYDKWAKAIVPALETVGLKDAPADTFEVEDGFRSLSNGRDLTGWGLRPTTEKMRGGRSRWRARDPFAPVWPLIETPVSFAGRTSSPDGRFVAQDGRIVVTRSTEGRTIQQLWTEEEFTGDLELRLEFRAMPNADSGVFIKAPQLQCRDYLVAGPFKELKTFKPQDWNEMVVVVKDGVATGTCNGEPLGQPFEVPEVGPIGLEGDRGQVEYRRIRVKAD